MNVKGVGESYKTVKQTDSGFGLDAQAGKWSQRAPTLQLVILKEEQRRKGEKRKEERHGETKPVEQGL